MRVVIITGASGSGKTTIAKAVGTLFPDLIDVYHFDAIGVPSLDAMIAGWGSGEEWQRATTLAWLKHIASERERWTRPALLEGQMRIAFILEGLNAAGLTDARVVLVDCDDECRTRRLIQDRQQPALASSGMMSWATYLRDEASKADIEVLDTARMPVAKCTRVVADWLINIEYG